MSSYGLTLEDVRRRKRREKFEAIKLWIVRRLCGLALALVITLPLGFLAFGLLLIIACGQEKNPVTPEMELEYRRALEVVAALAPRWTEAQKRQQAALDRIGVACKTLKPSKIPGQFAIGFPIVCIDPPKPEEKKK